MFLDLQDTLQSKSALLDASNARIANLERKLKMKDSCIQKDKQEMELVKEHFNKQLSELKEECRILREKNYQYEMNEEENEFKKQFLENLPKFSADALMVDSNISVNDQEAEHNLGLADIDYSLYDVPPTNEPPR